MKKIKELGDKIMKKLLLIIFLCLSLNANINQAVLGIIGSSDFNTHRNLINTLFKNQSYFYTNGSLDYAKISQTLQNNNTACCKAF